MLKKTFEPAYSLLEYEKVPNSTNQIKTIAFFLCNKVYNRNPRRGVVRKCIKTSVYSLKLVTFLTILYTFFLCQRTNSIAYSVD